MAKPVFLIAGQGLAGSLLSWFLIQKGAEVKVYDPLLPVTASRIANGLVNPVTGRRYALSWMFETLAQHALFTWRDLEAYLNTRFYEEVPLYKLLPNIKALNDWSVRCGTPEYDQYLPQQDLVFFDEQFIQNHSGFFSIHGAWQLDTQTFLNHWINDLQKNARLKTSSVEYDHLQFSAQDVEYENVKYDALIFCEGAKGASNPWFSHLPYAVSKGEVLEVELPGFESPGILNGEGILCEMPAKPGKFYAGSTYFNEFESPEPSETGKQEVLEKLKQFYTGPIEVKEHWAGLRPSTFDRRPFLGRHHQFPQLAIFNGMGTKGVSLAPYFAEAMADFLIFQKPLPPEVDIQRFKPNNE